LIGVSLTKRALRNVTLITSRGGKKKKASQLGGGGGAMTLAEISSRPLISYWTKRGRCEGREEGYGQARLEEWNLNVLLGRMFFDGVRGKITMTVIWCFPRGKLGM